MQIKLIFIRKVVHLALFWKWEFLELGSGLLQNPNRKIDRDVYSSSIKAIADFLF